MFILLQKRHLLFFLFFLHILFLPSVSAETTVTECGTITKDTILGANITTTDPVCFTILADDITVDCGFHEVVGSGSGIAFSISDKSNVLLRRCYVQNFDTGFLLENTDDSTLSNNHFSSVGRTSPPDIQTGIKLVNADNNVIMHTTGSAFQFLLLENANNNRFHNNLWLASSHSDLAPISLTDSDNNQFSEDVIDGFSSPALIGLILVESDNNNFSKPTLGASNPSVEDTFISGFPVGVFFNGDSSGNTFHSRFFHVPEPFSYNTNPTNGLGSFSFSLNHLSDLSVRIITTVTNNPSFHWELIPFGSSGFFNTDMTISSPTSQNPLFTAANFFTDGFVMVTLSDTFGNKYLQADTWANFILPDDISPSFTIPLVDDTHDLDSGELFSQVVEAEDNFGDVVYFLDDNTHFELAVGTPSTFFPSGEVRVFRRSNTPPGVYPITVTAEDGSGNSAQTSATITITSSQSPQNNNNPPNTLLPQSNLFSGSFQSLNQQTVEQATNIQINNVNGEIDFGNNVLNLTSLNLDNVIVIENDYISVDSSTAPDLNYSATLTFFNLPFNTAPNIFTNENFNVRSQGVPCPSSVCSNILYDTLTGTLTFDVAHFSSFYLEDANVPPSVDFFSFDFTLPSSTLLGGSEQERNKTTSAVFSITNNENFPLSNIDITFRASGISAVTRNQRQTNIQVSDVPSIIPPGDSTNVTVSGFIPLDFDAVGGNCREYQVIVGFIAANVSNGTHNSVKSFPLLMQAKSNLKIKDVDICVNDNCEDIRFGETVDNVKPEDQIFVSAKIKNLFDEVRQNSNELTDIVLKSPELTVVMNEGDFDIEEDDDISDLDPREEDTLEIDFDISSSVDDGSSDLFIRVCSVDENGALHGEEFITGLKVERDNHNVALNGITLDKSSVSCDREVSLEVHFSNEGRKKERQAKIVLENSQLNLFEQKESILIDRGSSSSVVFNFLISESTPLGEYPLTITSFYQGGIFSDETTKSIEVKNCTSVNQDILKSSQVGSNPFYPSAANDPLTLTLENSDKNDLQVNKEEALNPLLLVTLLVLLIVLFILIVIAFFVFVRYKK